MMAHNAWGKARLRLILGGVAISLCVGFSVGLSGSVGSVAPASAVHDVLMIDILSLTGNRITVVASSDDYIDNVKARIQSLWGVSPDQQQLIFGGRVLLDGKTLAFYGIPTGATLRLFLKLRGSPSPTPEPLADDRELSNTGQGEAQTGIILGGSLLLTAIGATLIARRRMSR